MKWEAESTVPSAEPIMINIETGNGDVLGDGHGNGKQVMIQWTHTKETR